MDRVYRLYKIMHKSRNSIYKKILHYYLRSVYACDIMPESEIGVGAHFAHRGLGVVINQGCIIGNNVKIGAHVVVGGRNGNPVVPKIGNNVEIGTGAILLGDIVVGDNVVIGAGTVLLTSIPDNAVVVGNPGRVIKYIGEKL